MRHQFSDYKSYYIACSFVAIDEKNIVLVLKSFSSVNVPTAAKVSKSVYMVSIR